MSSSFRLRQMIKEQKSAGSSTTSASQHIDSPFAKYLKTGELKCIVCDSIVRSEKAWPVHVNSKKHKDNIAIAKELKEKVKIVPELINQSVKRPASPPPPTAQQSNVSQPAPKKLKGILKNSNSRKKEKDDVPDKSYINKSLVNIHRTNGTSSAEKMEVEEPVVTNELPDGFFDNPKEDAKAHNREFKDPNDEEWERFQKEIKTAETVSTQIINEDQEEMTSERQIDEIDEQMRIWSKVLDLEKKKEEVVDKLKGKSEPMQEDGDDNDDDSSSEGSDVDIDEYLDWRAKKSNVK